jgi:hypothetical protein
MKPLTEVVVVVAPPLRWRVALVVGGIAACLTYATHFPLWAIAVSAIAGASLYLRKLPLLSFRIGLILYWSFVSAQLTSIFITPFTWFLRFIFFGVIFCGIVFFLARPND